jgi:hypothetical protein
MPAPNDGSFKVFVISGTVLLAGLLVGLGFVAGAKRVWPYRELMEAQRILGSLIEHGEVVAEGRRREAPEGAARALATVHMPGAAIGGGHYAIMGWDVERDAYAVRLFDAAGGLAHVWPIDEMAISERATSRQNAPHAMQPLPDGTLVVSFDWLGLVARLDPCGEAIWSRDGFYHHSFSPAADGGLWTWWGEGTAYGQIQDILKFDPLTGEDMVRISFDRDVVMRSPESRMIFSIPEGYRFVPDDEKPRDIFHPNDVEELPPELADAFPMFEPGDLMLSIRELDLVTVISPEGEIRWHRHGPWLMQHDPDFEPDGRISVFNNSFHRPRSSIVRVNPATGETDDALPGLEAAFKTQFRGKHQLLPNGNRLLTVPEQGQALEVTPAGAVAVEFNNPVPGEDGVNEDLVNAKWFPEGYFETFPACGG